MEARLAKLIAAYQAAILAAVSLMVSSGIPRPKSNMEWACMDIPQKGTLSSGITYYKHGYGCAVHLPSGIVDFDFGAQGQIDGFDVWRLSVFAGDELSSYGFDSEQQLKDIFKEAVHEGALIHSDYILYYVAKNVG